MIAVAALAALPGLALGQQPVGNSPNYQSPSAPNYQAPLVPPVPTYTLPPVPAVPNVAPVVAGPTMFVKHIEVRGVTAFKPSAIAIVVSPYENRTVSSAELQSLRVALTKLYIDKGYINSGVVLPDQQSKDGVVTYQAIEGSLTRVEVLGKPKLSRHYIASRVERHVTDPLNVADLQYALRYLQQDPNVQRLDARFGPGDALGQGILRLTVEDQPRFSAGIGGDNHHSSSTGANEGTAFFSTRDLTGYGDEFRGTVVRTDGDTEGSAIFSIPVSPRNAALQAYYSRASALIIQQPFAALNIKSTARTVGLSLTIPLVDRLDNRFSFFVGGEAARAYTELLGTPFSFGPGAQNGVSRVAIALGGVDWTVHTPTSVTDLRLTYRRGLDALGATIYTRGTNDPFNPNPTEADGRFGLEQVQFIHIKRLNGWAAFSQVNDRAQLVFRSSAQVTQKALLSLEKFTIGGVNTVRGVPENLLVRDNGATATLELQLPVPGFKPMPSPHNLVVVPFIDGGRSWDKRNSNPGDPRVDTTVARSIATAGLGLLWNPLRGLDAQVYWGRPIANNFHNDNPLDYVAHDLQYHGIHFAVNYVARW